MKGRLPNLTGLQWAALIIGLIGLIGCAFGAVTDLQAFLRAYLAAVLTWLMLPLGALGMLLVWHLMGGRWGVLLGDPLEAMARTLPLMALLFLPVLFDLDALYPWARAEYVAAHGTVAAKVSYLNAPFFMARAVLYFTVWIALAFALTTPRKPSVARARSLGLGVAGAALLALSASFAAVDWILSLTPTFHSSVFGMLWMSAQVLAAFAFALILALRLARAAGGSRLLGEQGLLGLGSILLTLVLLWGYFAFIQYLIVWSGDLPHAAEWYVARSEGAWGVLAWLIGIGHFALPAAFLLSSHARQSVAIVLLLAAIIVLTHFLDMGWLILPALEGEVPAAWLVAATMTAIGGLWLLALSWLLAPRTQWLGRTVEEASHG